MSFRIALLSISLLLPLHCATLHRATAQTLEQQLLSEPAAEPAARCGRSGGPSSRCDRFPPALFRLHPMSCRVRH